MPRRNLKECCFEELELTFLFLYTGKRVAIGLSTILSDLLPPTCDDEMSLKLLRELCTVATSILRKTSRSKAHFEVVFGFICKFLLVHGETVEIFSVAARSGHAIQGSGREIGTLLEELVLRTVASVQELLGDVWTSRGEQRNGQDAFESNPSPPRTAQKKSNESLAGMLSFLKQALVSCPTFLLHLHCVKEHEGGDLLFRRAVDSAVASLNDNNPEITGSAIGFLNALVCFGVTPFSTLDGQSSHVAALYLQTVHSFSKHERVRSSLSDTIIRIRVDAIDRLLIGVCGKCDRKMLPDVSELLSLLLRSTSASETESYLSASLRQDHFLLGDRARHATLGILVRCGAVPQKPLAHEDRVLFLKDVWRLHQIEDADALPGSDEVALFLAEYS